MRFYYDENERTSNIKQIIGTLEELENSLGMRLRIVERKNLSIHDEKELVQKIRSMLPQMRGSIVTSRNSILPLSGSKRLNLTNTPILVVTQNEEPVYVFPCKMGEKYYDVEQGIQVIRKKWPSLGTLEMLDERAIVDTIKKEPSKLENGLVIENEEYETLCGKIDLVLRDSKDSILVLEIEREAHDSALGQILRLATCYEKATKTNVRPGIACLRVNDFVAAAARRAKVEIWKMKFQDPIEFETVTQLPSC